MKKIKPMIIAIVTSSSFCVASSTLFSRRKIINRLVATGLILVLAVANADCRIFQHRDYGGSGYTLHHFERMVMVSGESLGCTTNGHGGGCESTIYEPSWNDQVSSFWVTDGCILTLWEDINQGGAYFRTYKSYLYVGGDWNDEASEALCMCQ